MRLPLAEVVLDCVTNSPGPVRDPELAIDVREVELDGVLGDPEVRADRGRRLARRDGREDRLLTLGQNRVAHRR